MKIEIFTLCDGAYNYGGKLTIVGTYDQLNIVNVPQRARVSVAVKICASDEEVVNGSKTILSFRDSSGNQVAEDVVKEIANLPENAKTIHLAMAVSVDLNISTPGLHKVGLWLNDKLLVEKMFPVDLVR